MCIYSSNSESDTVDFAKSLIDKHPNSRVFFLEGNLGAGKTTFMKGVMQGLKTFRGDVSSPTYTYVNEYLDKYNKLLLLHLDLYRAENGDFDKELFSYLTETDIKIFIEWPDRIGENLLKFIQTDYKLLNIEIQIVSENKRNIKILENE